MKSIVRYLVFTLFVALFSSSVAQAQSMKVSGTQVVRAGETLTLNAGQVVEFEPGALLQVEGNLQINGTPSAPVLFKSSNPDRPGLGILISGISETGKISVSQAQFEGLVQALRFDPFWYRSKVDLNELSISRSASGEPVIYVSKPLLDLRDGMDIQFTAKNLVARNNASGFLFESIGADGIVYRFDNFFFQENRLSGSDASMGVLHLEAARPLNASQVSIGAIAFNRNYAGESAVGLSVGGGLDDLRIGTLHQNDASESLVYDRSSNSRIPRVVIDKTENLSAYKGSGASDYVVGANHRFGRISLAVVGNPSIVRLQDSLGRPVFNNSERMGDSLILTYLEGNPVQATLNTGALVSIPKLTAAQLPPPIYRNIDTTLISPIWPDTTAIGYGGKDDGKARIKLSVNVVVPVFKGKDEVLKPVRLWEYGFLGGGSIYDGRDMRWRFYPIPASLEYSFKGFAQYNVNQRFSFRATYNYTAVSMHNIWGPGLISGTDVPQTIDTNGNLFSPWNNSFSLNFLTRMHVLEVGGIWNLKSVNYDKKNQFIPYIGLGLGAFYYNPIRMTYAGDGVLSQLSGKEVTYSNGTMSFAEYKSIVYQYASVNLRDMGTEGQQFNPGSTPYGKIAGQAAFTLGFNWRFNRINLRAEATAAMTSTDYLDDFGKGAYYGGDYETFVNTAIANNPDQEFLIRRIFRPLPGEASRYAYKATNNLPDGYYQLQGGLSYTIFKN